MSDPAPFKTIRQIDLAFSDWRPIRHLEDPLHKDLSAVARAGNSLFVACDETASVERLTRTGENRFGDHVHISLADIFDLPAGAGGEMDIEGLAASEGYLWVVGSHSLKRSKPKRDKHDRLHALTRLEDIDREPNRYFLGRVPLEEGEDGICSLVKRSGERHAACLKIRKRETALARWLRGDPHLGCFLDVPSKENGLDVEGIAVRGDRVWLGLRGPVLRGHAVVLGLDLKEPKTGRLKARRLEGPRRYLKFLIETRGLGIRDMRIDGDDLLLLVGPTMALEGAAFVLRWRDAVHDGPGVVDPSRIEVVTELPYSRDVDHPEGLELWPEDGAGALMVIYDAPAPNRMDPDDFTVRADVVCAG